ncbi:hypothetical protein ACQ4LE_007321 [Meloidogyne hapla]
MYAFAVLYMPLLFHLFVLPSSQVNTALNSSVSNNSSDVKNIITTKISSSIISSIQSTTIKGEEGTTTTTTTTTVEQDDTKETIQEKTSPTTASTSAAEDPWDKGVTLSSPGKAIATSTVVLAAFCIALLITICNVYCFGKTRGYI